MSEIFFKTCFFIQTFISCQAFKSDINEVVKQVVLSDHRQDVKEINLIFDSDENFRQFNDFVDGTLQEIEPRVAVRWVNLTREFYNLSDKKTRFFFNVLFVESLEEFYNLLKKIASNRFKNFESGGYYLIIFQKASINDLTMIFGRLWDLYIHNVIVLTTSRPFNESVSIFTFEPFNEFGCNKTNPIKVSEFSNGKFEEKPTKFFPNKIGNLHKCAIKVSTFFYFGGTVLKEDFANGSRRFYGRDVDIIKALGDLVNFTPNTNYLEPYGNGGSMLSTDGIGSGVMNQAIRRETDFILGNLLLKLERSMLMDYSYTYYIDHLILVIPPGQPLTSFQKLLRPFNIMVWTCLGVTISCGFIVITILQLQSKQAKELFYGKGITNPYLNFLIAVFGGTQHVLPKANFSRYLLMMFLLFCLVIRSLYTGSLYLFLQSNDHEKEPQTIEEMGQRDYKFYMISSYKDLTDDSLQMRGRRIIVDLDDLDTVMNKTFSPYFKGGVMNELSQVLYMNQLNFRDYSFKVCKEFYMMVPISIYFPKNSYLAPVFNKKLMEFEAAGLAQYWSSATINMKYLNFVTKSTGPKQLNLQHLSGTFQMIIGGLIASIVLFTGEIFWFHINRLEIFKYFKSL